MKSGVYAFSFLFIVLLSTGFVSAGLLCNWFGFYWFEHKFNIDADSFESGAINGMINAAADNSYEVYLNGNKVGGNPSSESFRSKKTEEISESFISGENTLSIKINNGGGGSGLIYSMDVDVTCPN
mgnify:CR=1 FL=1